MRLASVLLHGGPDLLSTFSYDKFLRLFPPSISLAFGYGSGVFAQKNNEDTSKKMLDFIFVVNNSYEWHKANLDINSDHYAFAGKLSSIETFHNYMDDTGAGVIFNTGILNQGRRVKYGVISESRLISDLNEWNTLYISGRLHKPVHVIHHAFEKSPSLVQALKRNLESSLTTALLLLPDSFSEKELFLTIAGLSYQGDIRMGLAEDPNKVSNIVEANMQGFRGLYTPILNSYMFEGSDNYTKDLLCWKDSNTMLIQDKSPVNIHNILQNSPSNLILELCCVYDSEAKHIRDIDEIIKSIAKYPEIATLVRKALANIVGQSSKSQTIKNLATVGPLEAVKYSSQKISKMLKSLI